ncbi:MAG TPA: HWE histidine kinase domain-containing protein [Microvirga sp.]|jgi:PAS domain S-box-containing protein|nr:HWE histidine kinase domain-containing protein [Microvirga sp.]
MGERIRSHNWAETPLGPIEGWPASLKTAVSIMLTTRHPVFIFWGEDFTCLYNDAFTPSLGPEKHPFILGQPARVAWSEAYHVVEEELRQVLSGGEATWHENYLIPIVRNGRVEEVYWTYSYGPIPEPSAPSGVGGVLTLITETTKSMVARRESEERYRTLLQSIDEGFCIIEMMFNEEGRPFDYRFMEVNHVFEKQTGLRSAVGRTIRDFAPDFEQHWFDNYGRVALTGESIRFENEAKELGRWFDVYAAKTGQPSERLVAVLFNDITERKRWEEHQRLLINELNHRVKNTLATVQSVVSQTLRNAVTPSEAKEAIESRLLALSRAHDVLTRENWEGADLHEVVEQAVAPYSSRGEDRLHLSGPLVRLPPRIALPLAMALQELATNAVKYGALSNATGKIQIEWTLLEKVGERYLHLCWSESGGPPVREPTRRGFGTRLIERSLAQDLGGEVMVTFEPTGLVCTVDAELPVG